MKKIIIGLALAALALIVAASFFFTVDESEYVVLTQFGDPISTLEQAGLDATALGRRRVIDISFDSSTPARVFVDLFELSTDAAQAPRHVASLEPDTTSLTHEVTRDASYLLRVQPELLRGGRFTLVERTESSLAFPVSGLDAGAVQSRFGVERDGGARGHEGIDIFAPRGTPRRSVGV